MNDARNRLREAAEAHRPDREAMLARIEQGMTRRPDADRVRLYRRRRQASWLKVTLAALAAVGALGLGGLALAAGVQQRAPRHTAPVAVTPTGDAAPRSSAPTTRPPASSGTPTSRHSAAPTSEGPISARGDVDAHSTVYWAQNNLTVDVAQPLTTLTVELRIAQTGGVQSTGDWQTAPADDFTITVTPSDGFLVYRWTLKPGRTVPAARQLFAAQFNHGVGKRDAGRDTFLVEATTDGRTVAVRGVFPAGGTG